MGHWKQNFNINLKNDGVSRLDIMQFSWNGFKSKLILKTSVSKNLDQDIKNIERLQSLSKPYFPQIWSWKAKGQNIQILIEYIEGISLKYLVEQNLLSNIFLNELKLQLNELYEYLLEENLVHGDLSPTNILINSTGKIKIIDGFWGEAIHPASFTAGFTNPSIKNEKTINDDLFSIKRIQAYLSCSEFTPHYSRSEIQSELSNYISSLLGESSSYNLKDNTIRVKYITSFLLFVCVFFWS